MKYAIVESGGKQYKAVEGEAIEVDRLPVNAGDKVGLERVLMLVDGDDVSVGTPTVDGIQVSTTVVDHFKGPKITVFKYVPKNRIRVKRGHRQQYTRLMVDVIGKPGESSKAAKTEKKEAASKSTRKAKKPAEKAKKAEKAPAKKSEKAPAKKTTAKKTTKTSSTKEKKSSSTKKSEK